MTKPLLHFTHGNSFPAGVYRRFFDGLRDDFDVRALDMHGHDEAFPVSDGWPGLVAELIAQLERYPEPAILVGHSLGGMLSVMAAKQRPDLVRCVVMLDSPVVAGWRALVLRLLKNSAVGERYSPARFSARRRMLWPDAQAAHSHFAAKELFAGWAPNVLGDYMNSGLKPHPDGMQLRFTREVETAVYRTLPHHIGGLVKGRFPVPVGFIGGTDSVECRQAGLGPTRKLVGRFFRQIPGGHLFPMQAPDLAARATREMIAALLAPRGRDLAEKAASEGAEAAI
jgi:pimeloyl-ACP methyl ester carboxylesterase